MNKQPPSIFNDVIGPVMRGPSSSHTAASARIGQLVKQFFSAEINYFHVEFESRGSLAATYSNQGSDFGLVGGLLGMDPDDPYLRDALEIAAARGIDIGFHVLDFETTHPNTYRITAKSEEGEQSRFVFISSGGGMFELQNVNGVPVSIYGDFHETLLFFKTTDRELIDGYIKRVEKLLSEIDYCLDSYGDMYSVINIKTGYPLPAYITAVFARYNQLESIVQLEPVLPVRSRKDCVVPYASATDILEDAAEQDTRLWKLAVKYESARGDTSGDSVLRIGRSIVAIMRASLEKGLAGSDYADRILGPQAHKILSYEGPLSGGERDKNIISNITAIMENKSAMGVIVAAPTAGSCGCLPGTLFAVADELGLDDEEVLKGLLAAGLIGVLIANRSTFAAEECGCQAECGAASGMTAAALVEMLGGTVEQALDAAAIALQNLLGMVCDPVAERVEVPCLGKNITAGFNAIAAANMVLAGFDKVIPLDETIGAMHQVGSMIPVELRCTGRAGLSVTVTAKEIATVLEQKKEAL